MINLEQLAARVEAAEGADAKLFHDAWLAVFLEPARRWEDEECEQWTIEYRNWRRLRWKFRRFVEAEAWTDAAMTLIPEGWNTSLKQWPSPLVSERLASGEAREWGKNYWRATLTEDGGQFSQVTLVAATHALALCAAALRARARMEER